MTRDKVTPHLPVSNERSFLVFYSCFCSFRVLQKQFLTWTAHSCIRCYCLQNGTNYIQSPSIQIQENRLSCTHTMISTVAQNEDLHHPQLSRQLLLASTHRGLHSVKAASKKTCRSLHSHSNRANIHKALFLAMRMNQELLCSPHCRERAPCIFSTSSSHPTSCLKLLQVNRARHPVSDSLRRKRWKQNKWHQFVCTSASPPIVNSKFLCTLTYPSYIAGSGPDLCSFVHRQRTCYPSAKNPANTNGRQHFSQSSSLQLSSPSTPSFNAHSSLSAPTVRSVRPSDALNACGWSHNGLKHH